jgi:hypothetical protein
VSGSRRLNGSQQDLRLVGADREAVELGSRAGDEADDREVPHLRVTVEESPEAGLDVTPLLRAPLSNWLSTGILRVRGVREDVEFVHVVDHDRTRTA